jgi:hypothetical protein
MVEGNNYNGMDKHVYDGIFGWRKYFLGIRM